MEASNEQPAAGLLSERELEVVRLLAKGLTNIDIGQQLFLSPETIKWYNKQIYEKLGVSSRSQAAGRARELGLFGRSEGQVSRPVGPAVRMPAALTSFVGRERETAELLALLKEARLVTITGPGGTGKTRLSLEIAGKAAGRYVHGAMFVGLATTGQPDQVASTIAQELGVVEQSDRPLVASLQHNLAGKELLLVLDNFEHLLSAGPLVADLLAAAPRLTVLATSRELLRLSGEHEYPLYPLALPAEGLALSGADLAQYEATALFNQRATVATPGFRLTDDNAPTVAAICRRLDGLPLAIELAAARVKLFPPQQLLERLSSRLALLKGGPRDRPARQRTLRATIDWSYQILTPEEQRFFARLAVFVGGRTIEAVEAICIPGLDLDAVDGLASMLDKSLLYQETSPDGRPRFMMLETIHEFARDCLAAGGEEQALRDCHLAHFLTLAEDMEKGYRWHDQRRLLEQTVAEMNNLRAAFEWAMSSGDYEAAARLAAGLDYYFYYQGSSVEGLRWFKRVQPFTEQVPQPYRIRFLIGIGRLAWVNNQLALARKSYEQALFMAQEAGDAENEAWCLAGLAGNDLRPESYAEDMALGDQALTIFETLDNQAGLAQTLNIQGELARVHGDATLAREKYEQALAICRETGEIYRQTMLLSNLSMIAYSEGDYDPARVLSTEALRNWQEIDGRQGMISQLSFTAGPLARQGDPLKAARLLGASAALYDQIGAGHHPTDVPHIAGYQEYVQVSLGEEAYAAAWAEGQRMTLEEAVAYALEP